MVTFRQAHGAKRSVAPSPSQTGKGIIGDGGSEIRVGGSEIRDLGGHKIRHIATQNKRSKRNQPESFL